MRRIHCSGTDYAGTPFDIIVSLPTNKTTKGPSVPIRLGMYSSWIYDLDENKVEKNRTGDAVVPCINAQEVDVAWLAANGLLNDTRFETFSYVTGFSKINFDAKSMTM